MYDVQILSSSEVHTTDVPLTEAEHTARSLANWNHACRIVDRATGEEVQRFKAYCDLFNALEPVIRYE
jgi:hypothetical protein